MPEVCFMTKVWRSGAAWVAQMIAQAIAEQGVKIAFVAPLAMPEQRDPAHDNLTRIRTPRELVGKHGKVKRIIASLGRISSSLGSVCRMRFSTKVFMFSIPEPLVFTLPLFAFLRLTGAKVIFIVHDAVPHAWALPASLRFVERGAHALSYKLATHLVTLSTMARQSLIDDFGTPADKVTVIPHGPFTIGNVAPIPGNGRLLIFGSLRRNKSVLEVIEGVILSRQRGSDVVLVLAGVPLKQEEGYWQQCLAAIARDPAGFDVRSGFVPDEALPELFSGVDAVVLAYANFNSQSGVGVMAALAGRPVIGTRSGGLGELYDSGMSGQIVEGEVGAESVAKAIAAFRGVELEEWRERARLGASRAAAALRWDEIARQYIQLACDDNQPLEVSKV